MARLVRLWPEISGSVDDATGDCRSRGRVGCHTLGSRREDTGNLKRPKVDMSYQAPADC